MINSVNYVSEEEINYWIEKTQATNSQMALKKSNSFEREAPIKIKNSTQFYKKAIEGNFYLFHSALEEIKKDREIAALAISKCPHVFYILDSSFRDDESFIINVINKNENIFRCYPGNSERNFRIKAIEANAKVLSILSYSEDLDDDFLCQAFTVNALSIFYIKTQKKQLANKFVDSLSLEKIMILLNSADAIANVILSNLDRALSFKSVQRPHCKSTEEQHDIANEKIEKMVYFNELKEQLIGLARDLSIRQNVFGIQGDIQFHYKKLGL